MKLEKNNAEKVKHNKKNLLPLMGFEPRSSRMAAGCANHYTIKAIGFFAQKFGFMKRIR